MVYVRLSEHKLQCVCVHDNEGTYHPVWLSDVFLTTMELYGTEESENHDSDDNFKEALV